MAEGGIGPETKKRVLEVARTLGYRASRFARGLRRQDSVRVGLLLDDLANPYYPEMASGVLQLAEEGWQVVIGDSRGEWDRKLEALKVLVRQADVRQRQVGDAGLRTANLVASGRLPGPPRCGTVRASRVPPASAT
ncbi:hypothetical protein BIV57_00685 [Mangrovactinospora gilvigrisea]|uniref:HTH lacI-type domain-containing protein n=1 Tax=Mangrovactinospora gilvigrisea TaxID=1428644 RepID=A0A1J7C0Z2_9ACTN|nr:hypothetical protein BIV57_00685 [Mangrovactinospora gilvigrisea]